MAIERRWALPAVLLLLVILLLVIAVPAAADEAPPGPRDPLAPLEAADWTSAAAAHLLRRAGFGGTLEEVEALHALGLEGAVDRLIDYEGIPNPGMPGLEISVRERPDRRLLIGLTEDHRREKFNEYQREDREQLQRVRDWWVRLMIESPRPLEERMTLFWHGHFTSAYRTVRDSYHLYIQNALFRGHATGSFRRLLHAVTKDPAMLRYLDGMQNRKASPNENYAREVMELFTLGVGNYTERDVQEAARALTGWNVRGNRAVLGRFAHDEGEKTVLGKTGTFDADQVLDVILEQPAAPRWLASRLFTWFAHDHPSDHVVDSLAAILRANDWELKPVLRALFRSREFYSSDAVSTGVKGPTEFVVGLYRALEVEPPARGFVARGIDLLGQDLFDPPNVKGWAGGEAWITTSLLLNRYNLASALVGSENDQRAMVRTEVEAFQKRIGGGAPPAAGKDTQAPKPGMEGGGMEGGGMEGGDMEGGDMAGPRAQAPRPGDSPVPRILRMMGAGRLTSKPFDPTTAAIEHRLLTAEAAVDHYARLLLAVAPSAERREAWIAALGGPGPFDPSAKGAAERLRGVLQQMVATPEFQLN